ncbi:hypothetical protein [Sphingobacterium hungaricum]|uniref:DUF2946 domain-containing protein n=1 Tax=Sphingobacterium hungaricum TaxID=2082723 RepID=A0A928UXZ7_9SPHI|nr:hypothetical protein [Sphingobacterium hungaricum]MBE8715300.1 hypothetical protein [Sphingobacterium hungaricum]
MKQCITKLYLLGLLIISVLGMTSLKYTHTHEVLIEESACHSDKEHQHQHTDTSTHSDCALCLLFHHQHATALHLDFIKLEDYALENRQTVMPIIHFHAQDYLAKKSNKDPPYFLS